MARILLSAHLRLQQRALMMIECVAAACLSAAARTCTLRLTVQTASQSTFVLEVLETVAEAENERESCWADTSSAEILLLCFAYP